MVQYNRPLCIGSSFGSRGTAGILFLGTANQPTIFVLKQTELAYVVP